MSQNTDATYLAADPFFGDEAELSCRSVSIRTARKHHKCTALNGQQDCNIQPGQRYRHERALVDGECWGEYRICLICMDTFISMNH